jgi:hypothetical protein
MGLIRKSLAVSTLGMVKASSKKQRAARHLARGTAETNRLLAEQNALLAEALAPQRDEQAASGFHEHQRPVFRK